MSDDQPYLGEIVGKAKKKGLDRDRWIEIIGEHQNLAVPPAREGVNPFTKERVILKPRPDMALVVIEGETVGTMDWSQDSSKIIEVSGDPALVLPLAEEIAGLLGGRFEPADDLDD